MASQQKDTPEVLRLIELAQNGNSKAETELVMIYDSYVEYMVSKYSKKTMIKDDDDLRSYVHRGLLDGIRKFDPDRNTTFIYGAHIWMKKHIFADEAKYRFIRLPANKKATYESFLKRLDDEINYELGNKDVLNYIAVESTTTSSFSDFSRPDEESDRYEMPEDAFLHKIIENFEEETKTEVSEVLSQNFEKALSGFNEKERFVIEHTFGLGGVVTMKSEDIATALGVSKVHVNDIKNKVIRMLRHSSFKGIIFKGV